MDKTLLDNFGYRNLFRHPSMSFMENPKKRRYFFRLNPEATEKEILLFGTFVMETLKFKRLRSLDLIDHIETVTETEHTLFSQWTDLIKRLMDVFPVRALVRISKRGMGSDPVLMERWEAVDWGRHEDRVTICSTLEEAESFLDVLWEKEMLQGSPRKNPYGSVNTLSIRG